jgi:L-ascorbate metabolism protein UlaG (beta-lactamase superfamily)
MKCNSKFKCAVLVIMSFLALHAYCNEPEVKIHYLGHASFLLRFGNDLSVITDYGNSKSYGLNSPVYSFSGFKPTIVTYSHSHTDHYNSRVLKDCSHILTNTDSIELDSLKITPITVSEADVATTDNSAYLFSYKGLKILHIADIQAYLTQITDTNIVKIIQTKFSEPYDLVFLTIDGVSDLTAQAAICSGLLKTKRIVPMHYWDPPTKTEFINDMRAQNTSYGFKYKIEIPNSADYELLNDSFAGDSISVISLDPAKFDTSATIADELYLKQSIVLCQNYPNPFHTTTTIRIVIPEKGQTTIKIFDLQGHILKLMDMGNNMAGERMVTINASDLSCGVYFYKLESGNKTITKRFEVIK